MVMSKTKTKMRIGQNDPQMMQNYARPTESTSAMSAASGAIPAKTRTDNTLKSRVKWSRVVFVICLLVVAAVISYTAYRLLTDSERDMASVQFAAFGDSALDGAKKIAARQKRGLLTMATIIAEALPNASEWPLVQVHGYRNIAKQLIAATSDGTKNAHFGFMPIVTPENKVAFEHYAFDVVMQKNASGEAMHDHIWNFNPNDTDWGSPNDIYTPFYQHSHSYVLFLMDWHAVPARGKLVDEMIACSHERALELQRNESAEPRDCSMVSDIVDLNFQVPVQMPAAVQIAPIYPADNATIMTGLVTSTIVWEYTLVNVFSNEVSGVDCVLHTDTQTFTYEITNGNVQLKGEGDLHDSSFDDYAQQVTLSGPAPYNGNASSPIYTLTAYPNEHLFHVYQTDNSTIAMIGSLCIILFTSILFFFYDFFVRTEFRHKDSLSQARRQFVRFISHEVRTPLNAVCMGLQLLKDETSMQNSHQQSTTSSNGSNSELGLLEMQSKYAELNELQDDILTSAHSAVGILNDLLNYDKVESGTLQLELAVLNIYALMEQVVAEFRQAAKLKKLDYELDNQCLTATTPQESSACDIHHPIVTSTSHFQQDIQNRRVIGDAARLCQVLRNVISNALKFTPAGGKVFIRPVLLVPPGSSTAAKQTSQIKLHSGETTAYLHGGTLQIQVQDTGAGMSPDQLKDLFREGVQFDVNKLQAGQGSGLGLYISKSILEQHSGSLTVASDGKGCGSTFTISLPLYYIEASTLPSSDQGLSRRTLNWDKLDPLNILVVDDSNMNRKLLSRLLRNHGHVCEEAENGKMAVERVEDNLKAGRRFDSILMDNEMPEMDGCTASRVLRAMGCDAYIVGITGTLFCDDVEKFKKCGANAVLPKPLDFHDLMDLLVEYGVADSPGDSLEGRMGAPAGGTTPSGSEVGLDAIEV